METKLRLVYEKSERSVKVRNISLLSIYCAEQIRKEPSLKKLIRRSGIPKGYENDVSKGLRIAEYVTLTESGVDLLESLLNDQ